MKALLSLAIALGLGGAARGENINFFWSTTGLANTSLRYSTALTNFLPIVSATPVTELPAGTHDLYLWGWFEADNWYPEYTQVYGVNLAFAGTASHAENAAYRHYKTGSGAYKRWDGSQGLPLNGVMAAVTARGIEFITPPDTNNDLYFPSTQQFLLGAALVTGEPGQVLSMALGPLGIAARYLDGTDLVPVTVAFVPVTFTPEPGPLAMLVLGLVGRRRGAWAPRFRTAD